MPQRRPCHLPLANGHGGIDLLRMAKTAPKKMAARKSARRREPKVLGITSDGVRILKPGRGTHFTLKEAREAVATVLAAKR